MYATDCRYFQGYKPCGLSKDCHSGCPYRDVVQQRILLIHLGALGAVLRSTSLLPAIRRRFPRSHLTWVTEAPAHHLLLGHPLIDRILTSSFKDILTLQALNFDVALVVDKSLQAVGFLKYTSYDSVFGFIADPQTGAIIPANAQAHELYELGLNDEKKFFINEKPETQLLMEALNLGEYQRDEYQVFLTAQEMEESQRRRHLWKKRQDQNIIIGLNTGCSPVIPYKKLSIHYHRELIQALLRKGFQNIVLLGGPEDTERNLQIAENLPVISSSTESGLRDGLVSVQACDVIVTGDSLGMHMGIALKKMVVAWFGPTCAHEIDLYGRGVKILSDSACSPCWKRVCHKSTMCYDQVDMQKILHAIESYSSESSAGGPKVLVDVGQ
jgi:heptosyltransferase-2